MQAGNEERRGWFYTGGANFILKGPKELWKGDDIPMSFRQHHWLNGHEYEQTLGDSEDQGSLACCSPWGRRVRYNLATEQQQQWVFKNECETDNLWKAGVW